MAHHLARHERRSRPARAGPMVRWSDGDKRGAVDLLVVGHVTRDEVDGGARLGGAASYAALAAACLGYETALVTVAPPDDPLLEPLRRAPRLTLHCVPSDMMTTFALDYAGAHRRLWLRRRARPLALDDL